MRKAGSTQVLKTWALTAAALMFSTSPGFAQTAADFYRDKTLTIMLGHPPGGSYDFYARLAADHLKKHLPGRPNILVQHRPGGGGVVAAAFFYANAPRDGATIALFPETIAHTQLLDPKIGRWKVQEMTYIGSFAPVNTAFVVRKNAPAQTVDELKTNETVFACTGANSQGYQYGTMLKTLAEFKFKMVCGYPGSSEVQLAMQRGEADITSSSWNSIRITQRDEIKNGNLKILIQGGLRRNSEMSQVPLMQELVTDTEAKRIMEFASAGAAIGRALLAPPNVPAERISTLRAAFDAMVKDPEFLAEAEKRGLEIDPAPGDEVQKISESIINAPPELIQKAAKAQGGG